MLFLTRKPGQSLTIHPKPEVRPETPLAVLFEGGPIRVQVAHVHGQQVRLGLAAHSGLSILREELTPFPAKVTTGAENPRRVLARRLKVLRFLSRYTVASLAAAAEVPAARVAAAETASGALELDDLEKLARVFGVKVAELFEPVGRTAEERLLLALLEGETEE